MPGSPLTRSLLLFALSAALSATACGPSGQPAGGATPAAQATRPAATTAPAASPAASPAAAAKPGASPAAAASPSPGVAASGTAQKTASGYPSKPIEIIVAFGPGGAADQTARLVSGYFQDRWGVPLNVINVPGGSGTVGTLRGLQATPDGYTVLMDNHATTSLMAASAQDLPFDWKNRTWIARTNNAPVFYAVKPDSPWQSLDDVVAAVKANPKEFTWSSAGTSAIGTWSIGQLLVTQGIKPADTNLVTFNSGNEAITAVAGGQVQLGAQQLSEVKSLVAANRIRLLAVVGTERVPDFPDVKTTTELGYPQLNVVGWQGLGGPPGIPDEIRQFWIDELKLAAQDPAFVRRGSEIGSVISLLTGEEFRQWVEAQYESYLPLAEALGVR